MTRDKDSYLKLFNIVFESRLLQSLLSGESAKSRFVDMLRHFVLPGLQIHLVSVTREWSRDERKLTSRLLQRLTVLSASPCPLRIWRALSEEQPLPDDVALEQFGRRRDSGLSPEQEYPEEQ